MKRFEMPFACEQRYIKTGYIYDNPFPAFTLTLKLLEGIQTLNIYTKTIKNRLRIAL